MEMEFVGKAVYLLDLEILAVADLHAGYEDSLIKNGIMIPKRYFKEFVSDMLWIKDFLENKGKKIKKVVVLGDTMHEFGGFPGNYEVGKVVDFLNKFAEEVVFVKGNHDVSFEKIIGKKGIELKSFHKEGRVCFMHGNVLEKGCLDGIDVIFTGHLHPVVAIRDSFKQESYKCFLRGKWKGKDVVILPSFSSLNKGCDVLSGENNLAIRADLLDFEVIIPLPDGKNLRFRRAREIGLFEEKLNGH